MQAAKRTVIEVVILVGAASAVALTFNGVRASGSLKLSKNYFDKGYRHIPDRSTVNRAVVPDRRAKSTSLDSAESAHERNPSSNGRMNFARERATSIAAAPPDETNGTDGKNAADGDETMADRTEPDDPRSAQSSFSNIHAEDDDHEDHPEHPYQEVSFSEVAGILADPNTAGGANVFIDARNDAQYREGHIPGALQVDHYQLEAYIDQVLPWIEAADKVVVYCNGGDCEDSIFVCGDLMDLGVPFEKVHLYLGGWKQWKAKGMPARAGMSP